MSKLRSCTESNAASEGHGAPLDRSRAALPSDYRERLEASNLPIEVATAIADQVDAALRSETDAAAKVEAYEIILRQIAEHVGIETPYGALPDAVAALKQDWMNAACAAQQLRHSERLEP